MDDDEVLVARVPALYDRIVIKGEYETQWVEPEEPPIRDLEDSSISVVNVQNKLKLFLFDESEIENLPRQNESGFQVGFLDEFKEFVN